MDNNKNINIFELGLPKNEVIMNNFIIALSKINNPLYKIIICAISGGSDSDIMLDICTKLDISKKIRYVWFDTGLEYEATKEHLRYLEQKYSITIESHKAIIPIPTCCKKYGQPFLSKRVSDMIERLQNHNFGWEDEDFETLMGKYPNCKAALRWWCNAWGEESRFNIRNNKNLKEFMLLNHPTIKISGKCCTYAKKNVMKQIKKNYACDLNVYGVRKSEGGARSQAYKNCFSSYTGESDEYRPLFFYKDADKLDYELTFSVIHSRCYTEYGLKRTGCAGCPYGQKFEYELEIINKYEPKLYKAVNNIFGGSYEYTRRYREFNKQTKN